ncbi:hypothetical protein [Gordoniibacillus kamchatkensis]|uniref:hypothetical protein n=1 Tax=Gordoniibacillus kamchatkensis TaxID=1590651 RepID=UPI000AB37967|nr:hypothetical protein [Paenibacillus sp. VKM B-2647]
MIIFRTVVGKLWLTIIGLVAVVLLILGLFLNQYLTAYFAQAQDQKPNLYKLADKIAAEAARHIGNDTFYELANEMLSFEDARMIVVTPDLEEKLVASPQAADDGLAMFRASDFFTPEQLRSVVAGKRLDRNLPSTGDGILNRGSAYLAVASRFAAAAVQRSAPWCCTSRCARWKTRNFM